MAVRTAVVTDSACDLPAELADRHGIRVIPLTVAFGDASYLDGVDLTPDAFWDRVAEGGEPTTASPAPGDFAEAWSGADAVVSIHLSSALSRTVETARAAAAEAPLPVEVVDSRSVSMGQGLVALAAADAATGGADLAGVAAAARSAASRLRVTAVLETVEFLHRGGRVGKARAALSELLRIRPILSLEDGEPTLVGRARTRRGAIDGALERVPAAVEAAAVFHARADDVDAVVGRVADATSTEPITALIGPVTGSHLGPGAIGVAVMGRP